MVVLYLYFERQWMAIFVKNYQKGLLQDKGDSDIDVLLMFSGNWENTEAVLELLGIKYKRPLVKSFLWGDSNISIFEFMFIKNNMYRANLTLFILGSMGKRDRLVMGLLQNFIIGLINTFTADFLKNVQICQ